MKSYLSRKNIYNIIISLLIILTGLAFTRKFDVNLISGDLQDMLIVEKYIKKYTQQELYSNLYGFSVDGNVITSTNNDPQVYLYTDGVKPFKYIRLDIDLLGAKFTEAQVFYAANGIDFNEADSKRQILKNGINHIRILPLQEYTGLRLDLTEKEGVSLSVKSVELTNKFTPPMKDLVLIVSLNILWFGICFLFIKNKELRTSGFFLLLVRTEKNLKNKINRRFLVIFEKINLFITNNKKTAIVISVTVLLFCGFIVERFKNNYSFFTQNDKLTSIELHLTDFLTDENIQIIGAQTFKSNTSNPTCDFNNGINVNPIKIRSVLVDAEWSSEQTILRVNFKNSYHWQKEISVPITNNLSRPFYENKKSDKWYVSRRVTSNNTTRVPFVIPCNYNDISIFRILFTSEPGVVVKMNKVIINPKLNFLFNFKLVEFLSISFLFFLIFCFLFIFPYKEKKVIFENVDLIGTNLNKPEKLFCILALIFGMIFVFLYPPLQSPDEYAHFAKSLSLSTFHLFPQKSETNTIGINIPSEFNTIFSNWYSQHYQLDDKKYNYIIDFLRYKNIKLSGNEVIRSVPTNSVFPVMYFPQVTGMYTIRLFENLFFLQDANILDIFYAGRIFNLLFYIIIGYFAIKTIPFYKYVIMSILLMPMSITQAASLSYDSCIIGLGIYLICLFFRIHFLKGYCISKKDAVSIGVIASLIINMKFLYGIILLVIVLFKKEKFDLLFNKIKRKKECYIAIILFVTLLSFFIWNGYIANLYWDPAGLSLVFNKEINRNAPPVKQLLLSFFNADYYRTLLYDAFENRSYYLEGIIGIFAWIDVFFPRIFITISIFFILVLSVLDVNNKIIIISREKIFFIFIYIIAGILILTAMYLAHGTFPDGRIIGVQGRYFIPVLPLLFTLFYTRLSLSFKLFRTINSSLSLVTTCFVCFSLTLSIMLLMFRFYT